MKTETACDVSAETPLFPAQNMREALIKCFNDDWNARRMVMEARDDDTITLHISYSATVPISIALPILQELLAKELS